MSIWRVFLCLVFPPIAVLDKGCGVMLLVGILWLAGLFPGIIAALIINVMDARTNRANEEPVLEKPKRKGAFVRLADGEVAEVIDDDGAMPEPRKRKDF